MGHQREILSAHYESINAVMAPYHSTRDNTLKRQEAITKFRGEQNDKVVTRIGAYLLLLWRVFLPQS